MASGSRHSIRYVEEAVRGTTPANPELKALRQTGVSLGLSKESLQSEEARNDRMIADIRHGARNVAGDINFELSYGSYDDILAAVMLGTWEVDGGGVGIDRLKAGLLRRYYTLIREFGDLESGNKFMRFTGCEFNTMSLQVNANAMVTGSFGVIGMDMVPEAAYPAGATLPAPLTTSALDSFTGVLEEAGAPIAVITEISVNLENGLEPRYVVGSKTSIKPSVGRSNANLNVTAFFENSDLLNKFVNETESSIMFELPDPAGNILQFVYPRVKYMGGQPDTEGEGPITLTMPVQALLDPVTGTQMYIDRIPA